MKIRVAIRLIVNSNLSLVQKLKQINYVINNELVQASLMRYPIQTYPTGQKILANIMRNRCTIGVYCLFFLRDYIGKKSGFRAILARLGIGKND